MAHRSVDTALPAAVADYFTHERETLANYLDLVPEPVDPDGDPSLGPVQALPWLYVADLTGWRGLALARLVAADLDRPCYRLSPLARDSVASLWDLLDGGPAVVHVELRGDAGPVPRAFRAALDRGYELPSEGVAGSVAETVVVFTDTQPSKRMISPLPAATAPFSGATLSYAPRESMLPEHPDGTTTLAAPPRLPDRTERLERLLEAALDGVGDNGAREVYVDSAVEALAITHSTIGKQDLLFDVSPRIALKHGHRLPHVGPVEALEGLRSDLLAQVPRTPGTTELRETLATLLAD